MFHEKSVRVVEVQLVIETQTVIADVNVTTRSKVTEEYVFKDREPRKTPRTQEPKCCWLGERRTIEVVNGGNNSTYSENINSNRRAIHIHGGMEHNLAEYVKYYSCGCTKISRSSEFTREIDHNRRNFCKHW